ncbi:MAG: 50S ribosomal protein L11 methyltransferase [Myxococcota bacterium]
MADEYRRFWITSRGETERELLLAEAFEAGAEGAEVSESEGLFKACIYGPAEQIEGIRTQLIENAAEGTQIEAAEPMPEVDWSEAWKEGLDPVRVSERLVVRPPFAEYALEPGQQEVVIDPGQAFGIGGHASTRLCLEWIDLLLSEEGGRARYDRVLDVGTGSGVLALAAVKLGAAEALGFDLDPIAIEAADEAARVNAGGAAVRFFTGPIEDVPASEAAYPMVLANLLKQEMLPIAGAIASRISKQGVLILAGLLEEDVAEVLEVFGGEGLKERGRLGRSDSVGDWVGLCLEFA